MIGDGGENGIANTVCAEGSTGSVLLLTAGGENVDVVQDDLLQNLRGILNYLALGYIPEDEIRRVARRGRMLIDHYASTGEIEKGLRTERRNKDGSVRT